uniref:DUF281 domain-containing protein n=1 Tax=Caenorhabditis tropicalis TaxID=1561998 RepID=A0A1I7UT46_9PELO
MSDSCIPMIPTEDVLPIATTEVIPVTEITTVPTSDPVEEEETTMAMTTAELTMTSTMTDMPMACDFNNIAPIPLPPNVEFLIQEEAQPDGSVEGWLICRRTDDMWCDNVHMFATNPSGSTEVREFIAAYSVGATFKCSEDRVFSYPGTSIDGITRLSCVFDDCA